MADITIHIANRGNAFTILQAQYYGAQTATNFEVISGSGVLIEANIGTGFTYASNGFFNGGTINENYIFSGDGSLAFSATGLSLSVTARNNSLTIGQSGGEYYRTLQLGNDTVTGSSGDDFLFGSKGNDVINGGLGNDVLSFFGFGGSVTVNLTTRTAATAFGTSTLTSIEDVEGSAFADTLTGNGQNNLIQGFGGNDAIDGGGGFDTASYLDASSAVTVDLTAGTATGGSGADTLSSIERVIGSRFNDTLTGSTRVETFIGGLGNDSIDGGGGVDTIEFSNVGFGVTVNLATGTTSGGAGSDTLVRIENVSGSIFADTISGNSLVNVLQGGGGNDLLSGLAGTDTLNGGDGADNLRGGTENDTLTGGSGRDVFRFDTALRSAAGVANIDTITDFVAADDVMQLENAIFAAFGAATGAIAATNFKIIQTGGATDADDFIVYNRTTGALFYDATGNVNGLNDAVQFAAVGTNLTLTNADFVLV